MAIKPTWKEAPPWAQYLAQDGDGSWFWYEFKPEPSMTNPTWMRQKGLLLRADADPGKWRDTLERRP